MTKENFNWFKMLIASLAVATSALSFMPVRAVCKHITKQDLENKVKEVEVEREKTSQYQVQAKPHEVEKKRYKISQEGLDLIKGFEGLRAEAYLCPAGVWTIGYGHTKEVKQGDTITQDEAGDLLMQDLGFAEKAVRENVKIPLTQNQYDALVSFVYNVGINAFEKSTLLRKLNSGDYSGTSKEFDRWIYASGKRLKGLENRRAKEGELFLSNFSK